MSNEIKQVVTIPVEIVAQAYLGILRDRGIKYIFGNSGIDFPPIVDSLAKFIVEKKDTPKPISVPHENVAVSMAMGCAMITGEPQVVMVHVGEPPLLSLGSKGAETATFIGGRKALIKGDFYESSSNGTTSCAILSN